MRAIDEYLTWKERASHNEPAARRFRARRDRLCHEATFAAIRESEVEDAAGRDQLDLMRETNR